VFGDGLKAKKPVTSHGAAAGRHELAGLDLNVFGTYANLHTEILLLVRAESRLHIEGETASPASRNIIKLLWEALLGLNLLQKSKWSYMRDLQKANDFL